MCDQLVVCFSPALLFVVFVGQSSYKGNPSRPTCPSPSKPWQQEPSLQQEQDLRLLLLLDPDAGHHHSAFHLGREVVDSGKGKMTNGFGDTWAPSLPIMQYHLLKILDFFFNRNVSTHVSQRGEIYQQNHDKMMITDRLEERDGDR